MASVVNLDALLPREDFLAEDGADAGSQGKSSILIPAVICWQSPSRLSFVIDGAHRLSAVIAWLSDDYGAGEASIAFYDNNIPAEQRRIAKKTKDLIEARVGRYMDYKAALLKPGTNPRLEIKARSLAQAQIPPLWVKGSDSKKAEKAFLTINQKATVIDPTELKILNDRFKPNAIVSRSIVRNATGYKYWSNFSGDAKQKIEQTAKEIYDLLYKPDLNRPIKSIDLPVAGHGYGSQTLPLIFDFVNIANGFPVVDSSKSKGKKLVLSDHQTPTEDDTLRALNNTVKFSRIITGNHPSSLGLHPAVYFYSSNGRHQPTSVLAILQFLKDIIDGNSLVDFCHHRKAFEDFITDHKIYINQLTLKYGSMAKGYRQVRDYYRCVFDAISLGKSREEITSILSSHDRFQILVKERPILSSRSKAFSAETKQWKLIADTLAGALLCGVCGAKVDNKSMHLDHIDPKSLGGLATGDNSQWAHPYCDSTYKAIIEKQLEQSKNPVSASTTGR
jgi:HNH endonuclease